MAEVIKKNKKIILSVIAAILVIGFAVYHLVIPKINLEQLALTNVSVGACAVQYNTCAFIEMKNEPWERSCEPIFKSYEVVQVGDKKVLLKELSSDAQAVFPKTLFRESSKTTEDALTNSMYVYISDCDKVKKATIAPPPKEEVKKEEPKVEIVSEDITDKCVVLANNCEKIERWEEESKYCHPFKNVYKVLEVGADSLRVVTWHGHGQTVSGKAIAVGTELNLSKEEYSKLGYKDHDCSDLVTKYPKTFNPVKGK